MSLPSQYLDFFNDSAALTKISSEIVLPPTTAIQAVLQFEELGIDSTKALIEVTGDHLDALEIIPRGGVGQPLALSGRKAHEVEAGYTLQTASVLADEAQGARGPGNTFDRDTAENLVRRKITQAIRNIDWLIATMQLGALKGLVTDTAGNPLLDLNALFGRTQPTQSLDLASTTAIVPILLVNAVRKGEDGLWGVAPTRWVAFASPSFMDKLRANPSVREVLGAWQGTAASLASDYRQVGAMHICGVDFYEVRGTLGGPTAIEEDTAYMAPLGVDGMFRTYYAPPPKIGAVNTEGLPVYTSAEPMGHGRGFTLNIESCPLAICTRPGGIVKLTAA